MVMMMKVENEEASLFYVCEHPILGGVVSWHLSESSQPIGMKWPSLWALWALLAKVHMLVVGVGWQRWPGSLSVCRLSVRCTGTSSNLCCGVEWVYVFFVRPSCWRWGSGFLKITSFWLETSQGGEWRQLGTDILFSHLSRDGYFQNYSVEVHKWCQGS